MKPGAAPDAEGILALCRADMCADFSRASLQRADDALRLRRPALMRRRGPVPGQYGRLPAAVAAVIGAMNAGEPTPSEAARSAVRHAISAHAYECFAVRGPIREIAAFLAVPIDEAKFPAIVEHCSFDYMKAHAEFAAPAGGIFWEGGGKTFINKGTNGRWRDTLTLEDIKDYEARAQAELGPECVRWVEHGG